MEVNEQNKPEIPHMSEPGCLMEDRPTYSIDEIVDAGELETMEGNEDEYLLCRQEVERGGPYGGDGEGVSPWSRTHGSFGRHDSLGLQSYARVASRSC